MSRLTFVVLVAVMFVGVCFGAESGGRPWLAQYKIAADQKDKLTAADVVGPDGIVYPNWTRCGVQGGIPQVKAKARITDFGGIADDGKDDSAALARACAAVGRIGGGAVLIGPGTWRLDKPVTIRDDNVVIRGAGADKTRLMFRYAVAGGASFFTPAPGAKVGRLTQIELHCSPMNLTKMQILGDGKVIGTWEPSKHSGNSFSYKISGRDLIAKVGQGDHTLTGIGQYNDGSKRQTEIKIVTDSRYQDETATADSRAAIMFAGGGSAGAKLKLTTDGKRGDTKLQLSSTAGLRVGDNIMIDGPATERWKTLTKNKCLWGLYRMYAVQITAITGKVITIGQPLRIEFPVVDGSYVQKVRPIQGCGVENLYLEQTENLWISGVIFDYGWNCWAKGVTVKMCGRYPVYGSMAKWCEIRDCVFDDAWFKGGGGTAYTGWDRCWDCLMENVETFKMRHAPLFQWAASGCVIRRGVFHDSDGQWHVGWTNENLIEQCVIESVRGNGGYGYGMWASPPEDTAHGPNGPRNVVYNCDVRSPKAGLWMGGMNERWMILHNRFTVDAGPGVFAKTASFDHLIKGNTFVLKDNKSPMVQLSTPDCPGVEIIDNKLHGGNGKITSGQTKPSLDQNNKTADLTNAPRPTPKVPSIYQWQQTNIKAR